MAISQFHYELSSPLFYRDAGAVGANRGWAVSKPLIYSRKLDRLGVTVEVFEILFMTDAFVKSLEMFGFIWERRRCVMELFGRPFCSAQWFLLKRLCGA